MAAEIWSYIAPVLEKRGSLYRCDVLGTGQFSCTSQVSYFPLTGWLVVLQTLRVSIICINCPLLTSWSHKAAPFLTLFFFFFLKSKPFIQHKAWTHDSEVKCNMLCSLTEPARCPACKAVLKNKITVFLVIEEVHTKAKILPRKATRPEFHHF